MRILCKVYCFKLLLCLYYPIARFRKLLRLLIMKQLKIAAMMMLASFCILTYLLYLSWNKFILDDEITPNVILTGALISSTTDDLKYGTPMRHMPLNEIFPEESKSSANDSNEFFHQRPAEMVGTSGCKIPVAMVDYNKYLKSDKKPTGTCGRRAVFLKKVGKDKVQAMIKPKIMKKYFRKSIIFDCCYRFFDRYSNHRSEDKRIKFTKCAKFKDNAIITLQTDFINIKCFDYDKRNVSHTIYDDIYAFAKSINVPNTTRSDCKVKYNVLMIGMDSMSLPRFVQTMTRTTTYFQDNFWLSLRGYHKVEDNTFPNLMAFLTGRNSSDISSRCDNKMDECHDLMIWNTFKQAGYVTAFGEDYLRLPDTFTNKHAFHKPPTDHYMRPFFLKGETELNNRTLVCAGKVPSGQQLLNYALDFANTYRSEQFFGLFWMNSFSHNGNSRPQDADVMVENFFNQLGYTGVMQNTFVIVLSDHGMRFGERRMDVESYYDERMPHMFILTPEKFRSRTPFKYKGLAINQFRLVTPYDLHHTLIDIYDISTCNNKSRTVLEACPNCHSLFDIASANRTCRDVAIHDKWCSCHKLYPLLVQDEDGEKSVQTAVSQVKQIVRDAKTKPCWGCMPVHLKKIIRSHFYYHEDKVSIYYVVAFTMTPGNASYEATVLLKDGKRTLVGPISLISTYRGLGKCTLKQRERLFCVCQKIEKC